LIEYVLELLVAQLGLVIGVGLFIVVGIALLKQGADGLVNGSSNLGLRMGISKVMTGLTIVAFGTSAPELVVSTLTALDGKPEICLGNVIGSNLANTALILGVSALISPIAIQKSTLRREGLHSLLSIVIVLILAVISVQLDRLDGILLLAFFAIWMIWLIRDAKGQAKGQVEALTHEVPNYQPRSWMVDLAYSSAGLLGLVLGANLLVEGAILSAKTMGIPVGFIGITVVAIGTSLPELAVSIVAAMKGHSELTVGNVFGSNIFNALLILGVACLIRPFEFVPTPLDGQAALSTLTIDLPYTVLICGLILPMMIYKSRLGRLRGLLLLGLYVGFIGFLIWRLAA